MDEHGIVERLDALEQKLETVYRSVEKIRRYLLVIIAGSVAIFLLPLIGLFFAIPAFMSTYQSIGLL